jgi:hypothetical protein
MAKSVSARLTRNAGESAEHSPLSLARAHKFVAMMSGRRKVITLTVAKFGRELFAPVRLDWIRLATCRYLRTPPKPSWSMPSIPPLALLSLDDPDLCIFPQCDMPPPTPNVHTFVPEISSRTFFEFLYNVNLFIYGNDPRSRNRSRIRFFSWSFFRLNKVPFR